SHARFVLYLASPHSLIPAHLNPFVVTSSALKTTTAPVCRFSIRKTRGTFGSSRGNVTSPCASSPSPASASMAISPAKTLVAALAFFSGPSAAPTGRADDQEHPHRRRPLPPKRSRRTSVSSDNPPRSTCLFTSKPTSILKTL